MKKILIMVLTIIFLSSAVFLFQNALMSTFLYINFLSQKDRVQFNFIQDSFLSTERSSGISGGEKERCGSVLSVIPPANFKVHSYVKKENTPFCVLKNSDVKAKAITIHENNPWRDLIAASKISLNGLKKIKSTTFVEENLSNINKTEGMFWQGVAVLKALNSEIHILNYDEVIYASVTGMKIPYFLQVSSTEMFYQEIDNVVVLRVVVGEVDRSYYVFKSGGEVYEYSFMNFTSEEKNEYLLYFLKDNTVALDGTTDEVSSKKRNAEMEEIRKDFAEKSKILIDPLKK